VLLCVCAFCCHTYAVPRTFQSPLTRHDEISNAPSIDNNWRTRPKQEVEPLLLIRSSGSVIYEVLRVDLLSACCSVFVLTNFEAPVTGCHGQAHVSCSQVHLSWCRLASADRRGDQQGYVRSAVGCAGTEQCRGDQQGYVRSAVECAGTEQCRAGVGRYAAECE
jgi:hypothetical protein